MPENRGAPFEAVARHWRPLLALGFVIIAVMMIRERWAVIQGFGLGDTDDNMRMMQVRALLEGQGWYDLRQYRMNPPFGADIHWSRLVDLPIAGLKLLFTPLLGGRTAELVAVTVAPLLAMLVALVALAVTVRRLVDGRALLFVLVLVYCAGSTRGMWAPLRIDHHGWQLAMLAVAIGMEMLLYFAVAGGVTVARWIIDREQARRLFAYGVALGGGCALAFLLFASEANRAPVCDALSPVWLSAMVLAGAIAVVLAWINPASAAMRLLAAALAGGALAGAFALTWPDCVGRLERSSPELQRLWLDKVREAMPVWRHGARIAALIVTLPIAGLIGYGLMIWRHRRDPERLIPWLSVASLALLSAALLLWQTRAGPAAQLLSIPGATALIWTATVWILTQRSMLARIAGVVVVVLIVSGLVTGSITRLFPNRVTPYRQRAFARFTPCR